MSAIAFLWQRWVGGTYLAELVVAVVLGVSGGYLVYAFIESPLNRLLHRKRISRPSKAETSLVFVEPA
jgi:peptidoglycan/LPS O-acetylase OafA/YrhL